MEERELVLPKSIDASESLQLKDVYQDHIVAFVSLVP